MVEPNGVSERLTREIREKTGRENWPAVVEAAVLAGAQADFSGLGEDVLEFKIAGIISDLAASGEITGVVKITVQLSLVGISGPFIDPVPIGISERADYDSANITAAILP